MANQQAIYIREEANQIASPCLLANEYNIGDFVAQVTGNAVSAADFTWNTNLATTQTDFSAVFIGHCYQYKAANSNQVYGNSTVLDLGVSTSGVYQAPLQSATTIAVGDWIGLAKNPSANELLSQVVVKVDAEAKAIGKAVEAGTDLENVKFRIFSRVLPLAK